MNRSELQIRIDELADDFLQRKYDGEDPSVEEFVNAYPDIATPLRLYLRTILMVDDIRDETEFKSNLGLNPSSQPDAFPKLDDYEVIREIGRGGMGIVYEAHHLSLDRTVALKVLPSNMFKNKGAVKRFQLEARSAARLHHTNIVPIFDVDQKDDICYYAMQYIQGQSLDFVVNELGKLVSGDSATTPEASVKDAALSDTMKLGLSSTTAGRKPFYQNVARLGKQASEALDHAHENGIVHRDIKPANLMLDFNGTIWIMDFGLAKTDENNLTQTGDVVGTLRYMSPERFAGQCDRRSDIYSLGMTMYEMLSQRPAFGDTNRLSLIDSIKTNEPAPLRKIDKNIPLDLETIVGKAIEKDPRRRYSTAGELAADLSRFMAGQPIQARRVGNVEKLWLWSKKRKALAASLAVLSLFLIAGTVASAIAATYYRDLATQNLELAKSNEDKTAEAQDRAEEAKEAQVESEVSNKRTSDMFDIVTTAFKASSPVGKDGNAKATAREVLFEALETMKGSDLDLEGRVTLTRTLYDCFRALGDYDAAIEAAKEELRIQIERFGDQSEHVSAAKNILGMAYSLDGKRKLAKEMFEDAVAVEAVNGREENQTSLSGRANLNKIYFEDAEYEKVKRESEYLLKIYIKLYGEEDEKVMQQRSVIADAYRRLGNPEKSVELFAKNLEVAKKVLGMQHKDTMIYMANLAVAYGNVGRTAEAIELIEEAIELMKGKFGVDHPFTTQTFRNSANFYRDAGDLDRAIEVIKESLERMVVKIGEDHPQAIDTLRELAFLYRDNDQQEDAIQVFRKAIELSKTKYGEDYLLTFDMMNRLAYCLDDLDRWDESIEVLEKVQLAIAAAPVTDPKYKICCYAMENLCRIYRDADRFEESVDVGRLLLERVKANPPKSDQNFFNWQNELALSYLTSKSWESAGELLENMLPAIQQRLPESVATFKTHLLLGEAQFQLGKLDEAVDSFVAAVNGFELLASKSENEFVGFRKSAIGRILKILDEQEKSNELTDWENKLSQLEELADEMR